MIEVRVNVLITAADDVEADRVIRDIRDIGYPFVHSQVPHVSLYEVERYEVAT